MSVIERYAEAWQDRRRRMVIFKATQIAGIAVIIGAAYLASVHSRKLNLLHPLLAVPAWFIAYFAAGVWLNRFRCPRCGKFYYWRLEWEGSMERQKKWRDCRHCGLPQDATPA